MKAAEQTRSLPQRPIAQGIAEHPGQTGVRLLSDAGEAYAARAALALAAERTIDALYYMWHADETGHLMLEALWGAAERGVRIRLVLDDATTEGMDQVIADLASHPNIEIRIYNALRWRRYRLLNAVTDFHRSNRRMHNKSFTIDGVATIVGGRNVGDEYFASGEGTAFADLDVLAIGPAAADVSAMFEAYWHSASACPSDAVVGPASPGAGERLRAAFTANHAKEETVAFLARQRHVLLEPLVRQLIWTDARLVYDDPVKTLGGPARPESLLLTRLLDAIGPPRASFDLVSSYFVPASEGSATLQNLASRGVRVRVLTNSLESTDVGVVHAGYAKRRRELLRAGVQLFELKRGWGQRRETEGLGRSSGASLHAKTFALDGQHLFVGSFNFDPRSARLNTEMGLVLDSPRLAHDLGLLFDAGLSLTTYAVRLAEDGKRLQWIEWTPDGERRHDVEPGTTVLQRLGIWILSRLPVEWLL
ncbi:MAG: phospholipase D family protein [Rhodothermales bacterium]